jgi:hypothetical protein
MIPPSVTLVTSCFNLTRFHSGCRSLLNNIESFDILLKLPCYLVIYGDSTTIPILKERRIQFGLGEMTVFIQREYEELEVARFTEKVRSNRNIYWPTKDSRTCVESHLICCAKFYFLQEVMAINPFGHQRFGWIDGNLKMPNEKNIKICEDYSPHKLLAAIDYTKIDRFHIQVINVLDKKYKSHEKKREMYEEYRWIMAGCFFTFGKQIGQVILSRLQDIFEETTVIGYGHAEEMFFLEVLDEFYDEIERSYGDYGQIINNWISPTRNIHYIYELILKKYYYMGYYLESDICASALIDAFQKYHIDLDYRTYMNILEIWYLSNAMCDEIGPHIATTILGWCEANPFLKAEYIKRIEYYDSIFGIASHFA